MRACHFMLLLICRRDEPTTNQKNRMNHPKNQTRFKSLNKIAESPLVHQIYDEGEDGIWVDLNFINPLTDTTTIHEWSVKRILSDWKFISKQIAE